MAYLEEVRLDDGQLIKYWRPFKTQEDFLKIPDSVREGFFGGQLGGGKSDILMMLPVVRGWIHNPRFHAIIFRKTFPQLEESLIPRGKDYYLPLGARYNATNHVFTFPHPDNPKLDGATIRLSYLANEDDAREHDTAEFNYIAFDELTHFSEWVYVYMKSRLRTSAPDLPTIMRSASNPGNIGHSWVKRRFIDPARFGYKLILDHKTNERRIFIPSSLIDNIHIQNKEDYANSLKDLPEAEYKAKVLGDWDAFKGQVFEEFLRAPLPNDTLQRSHVCEPFEIPKWWPRFAAIDWGYNHPTAILWGALSPDGRVYIYREYMSRQETTSLWAKNFAILTGSEQLAIGPKLDGSAWQNRGTNTVAQEFMEYAKTETLEGHVEFVPTAADNERLSGKLLIHEYLRLEPLPQPTQIEQYDSELAARILRTGNIKLYDDYLSRFVPKKPEVLPKLQIFSTCQYLINTIPMCVYVEDKIGKSAEDVKKWDATDTELGDDFYDDLRYLLKGIDKWRESTEAMDIALRKESQIYDELQQTGNQTAFHRRLEHLDRTKTLRVGRLFKQFRPRHHQ
jgi:hypothetical protein